MRLEYSSQATYSIAYNRIIGLLVQALICARNIMVTMQTIRPFFTTNASKLQAILNAASRLIGGITKFSYVSSFIRNSLHNACFHSPAYPIQDLLPHEKLSYWLCSTLYVKAYCIPFTYSICNFHTCAACLRYKQVGLLLLALRWTPCSAYLSTAMG